MNILNHSISHSPCTVQLQTRNGGAVCDFFLKLTTRTLQSSADSFYMIKLYTFYHLSCFELNVECDFVSKANNILFINPFRFSKHGFNSKRMIGRCASAACTCISASNLTRLLSSYSWKLTLHNQFCIFNSPTNFHLNSNLSSNEHIYTESFYYWYTLNVGISTSY